VTSTNQQIDREYLLAADFDSSKRIAGQLHPHPTSLSQTATTGR
jgi:hypothetical protein